MSCVMLCNERCIFPQRLGARNVILNAKSGAILLAGFAVFVVQIADYPQIWIHGGVNVQ